MQHNITHKIAVTRSLFHRGFTLIELLVVVLIIAILAAIALPQYQKAADRARVRETLLHVNTLKKAATLYVLENGHPSSGSVYLTGTRKANSDIVLPCESETDIGCIINDVSYVASCSSRSCFISAQEESIPYLLTVLFLSTNGTSDAYKCHYHRYAPQDRAKAICNSLGTPWVLGGSFV